MKEKSIRQAKKLIENGHLLGKWGKTFCSKLFFKLTSSFIEPQLMCLQILQYEKANRKKEEIEMTIPLLRTLKEFNDYYCSSETNKEKITKNLYEIAWVLFYSFYKKNHIIKKVNDKNEFFYLILNGSVDKYSLVFNKNDITVEEYLKLLLKLQKLEEFDVLKKMKILNKKSMNINIDNLKFFCRKYPQYNYENLKSVAIKELENDGFSFGEKRNQFLSKMNNIDNYLNLLNKLKNSKFNLDINSKKRVALLLPHYEKVMTLTKGMFIGDLSVDFNKDNYLYICKENSDIGYVDKKDGYNMTVIPNILIKNQMNTFKKLKNKFYVLQEINDNIFNDNYAQFFLRKTFKKGDKIFLQNSTEDGVFFIVKGEILIHTTIQLDKVTNLIRNLGESVDTFSEYISNKDQNEIEKLSENSSDKDLEILEKNRNFQNQYDILYKGEKKILIEKFKEWDIIGLNEMYNKNTELSNFTAECISDNCILYFISKKYFSLLISKEKSLFDRVVQLVELRSQYFMGVIKTFKSNFIKKIIQKIKSSNSLNKVVPKFPKLSLYNKTIYSEGRDNKLSSKLNPNLFHTSRENKIFTPVKKSDINYLMNTENDENMKSNYILNTSYNKAFIKKKNEGINRNNKNYINNYFSKKSLKDSLPNSKKKLENYSEINKNYNLFRENKILNSMKANHFHKDVLFSFNKNQKNKSTLFISNNLSVVNIVKKIGNNPLKTEEKKLPSLYIK